MSWFNWGDFIEGVVLFNAGYFWRMAYVKWFEKRP